MEPEVGDREVLGVERADDLGELLDRAAVGAVLARFGEPPTGSPGTEAVRLADGTEGLAAVVRALDADDLRISNLQLHAPTLDDVFLAKTGRHLEGAGAPVGQEPSPEAVTA